LPTIDVVVHNASSEHVHCVITGYPRQFDGAISFVYEHNDSCFGNPLGDFGWLLYYY